MTLLKTIKTRVPVLPGALLFAREAAPLPRRLAHVLRPPGSRARPTRGPTFRAKGAGDDDARLDQLRRALPPDPPPVLPPVRPPGRRSCPAAAAAVAAAVGGLGAFVRCGPGKCCGIRRPITVDGVIGS